jgi:hypothetical protein
MVFFIPVVGSKRITELAKGVNEYNETKSCDAEGLGGRCSIYIYQPFVMEYGRTSSV